MAALAVFTFDVGIPPLKARRSTAGDPELQDRGATDRLAEAIAHSTADWGRVSTLARLTTAGRLETWP
jgi:hypothetical protein